MRNVHQNRKVVGDTPSYVSLNNSAADLACMPGIGASNLGRSNWIRRVPVEFISVHDYADIMRLVCLTDVQEFLSLAREALPRNECCGRFWSVGGGEIF